MAGETTKYSFPQLEATIAHLKRRVRERGWQGDTIMFYANIYRDIVVELAKTTPQDREKLNSLIQMARFTMAQFTIDATQPNLLYTDK